MEFCKLSSGQVMGCWKSIDCLTFDFSCWIVSRNALCSRGNFSILIER